MPAPAVNDPIFEALKQGERFSVATLVDEYESVQKYWDWWWEHADPSQLARPQTVVDGDPWLVETVGKEIVDTETYRAYLSEFALLLQRSAALRRGDRVPRADYRRDLVAHVAGKGCLLDPPVILMTGGGYGAGKTAATDFLINAGRFPLGPGTQTGVDFFKAYLPEYCLLQRLADGRASTIVQDEARLLANELFDRMLRERRSFAWDSSLSNAADALARLKRARGADYRLILVAVFAPLEIAIRQAMKRARQTRRFAHPEHLPRSHQAFKANFRTYLPHFDDIYVFVNDGTPVASGRGVPHLVAAKAPGQTELAIHDTDRFLALGVQSP